MSAVQGRLETIANELHENGYEYRDCALSAAHTYEALVANGYRARIVDGELWPTAAPHWWAETIEIKSRNQVSIEERIYVVEPVSRTDSDFPEPGVYRGRPDDYTIPEGLSENEAIKRGTGQHARGVLATGFHSAERPQRPPLARSSSGEVGPNGEGERSG